MNRQIKGASLLPNFLTTGTLFCGFYGILMVERGDYQAAFGYIVLAAVFDLLDGYVARILRAQSEFGAHYDSLSDAVAFGVAPALLLFYWLEEISHIYLGTLNAQAAYVIPPIYLLCVIIRLARFNVTMGYDKRFFTGLPSPAAALGVCALVSLAMDPLVMLRDHTPFYNMALMLLALGISMLMISRLPFPSFKGVQMSKKLMPFCMVLMIILIALSVREIRWPLFLALAYIYAVALWHFVRSLSRLIRDARPLRPGAPPPDNTGAGESSAGAGGDTPPSGGPAESSAGDDERGAPAGEQRDASTMSAGRGDSPAGDGKQDRQDQ